MMGSIMQLPCKGYIGLCADHDLWTQDHFSEMPFTMSIAFNHSPLSIIDILKHIHRVNCA